MPKGELNTGVYDSRRSLVQALRHLHRGGKHTYKEMAVRTGVDLRTVKNIVNEPGRGLEEREHSEYVSLKCRFLKGRLAREVEIN